MFWYYISLIEQNSILVLDYIWDTLNVEILILFQELSSYRRDKERLSEELFDKADEKQNLELLLNQVQQENHRLSKKVENLEIIGKSLRVPVSYLVKFQALQLLSQALVLTPKERDYRTLTYAFYFIAELLIV